MAALLEATRPALKDVLGKVYSMSRDQVRFSSQDVYDTAVSTSRVFAKLVNFGVNRWPVSQVVKSGC